MTIVELLRDHNARIVYRERWLIGHHAGFDRCTFTVYENEKPNDYEARWICETDSEVIAVAALLNEEAEDA